ncbi:unnamed protein product [Closterium sp. Naga37s-1]|nr:unnamed protein product [Closterium sp. Naga37s-1]
MTSFRSDAASHSTEQIRRCEGVVLPLSLSLSHSCVVLSPHSCIICTTHVTLRGSRRSRGSRGTFDGVKGHVRAALRAPLDDAAPPHVSPLNPSRPPSPPPSLAPSFLPTHGSLFPVPPAPHPPTLSLIPMLQRPSLQEHSLCHTPLHTHCLRQKPARPPHTLQCRSSSKRASLPPPACLTHPGRVGASRSPPHPVWPAFYTPRIQQSRGMAGSAVGAAAGAADSAAAGGPAGASGAEGAEGTVAQGTAEGGATGAQEKSGAGKGALQGSGEGQGQGQGEGKGEGEGEGEGGEAGGAGEEEEPLVQHVVIRRDLMEALQWPLGSVITQGCHASVAVLWQHRDHPNVLKYCGQLDSMRKVTLEVKGETQLLNLSKKLQEAGITHRAMACSPPRSTAFLKGAISVYPRPPRVLSSPLPRARLSLAKGNDDILWLEFFRSQTPQQPSHIVARTFVRCDAARQGSSRRQSHQSVSAGATSRTKGVRSPAGAATAERLRVRKEGSAPRKAEAPAPGAGRAKGELDAFETWLCGEEAHRESVKGEKDGSGRGAGRHRGGPAQPSAAPTATSSQRAAQPRQQKVSGSDRASQKTGQSAPAEIKKPAEGRAARGGATHSASNAQQNKAGEAPRCRGSNGCRPSTDGATSTSCSSSCGSVGCTKVGAELPKQGRSTGGEAPSPRTNRQARRARNSYASLADVAMAGMTWIAGPEGVKIEGSVQRWREGEGRERRVLVERAVVSLQLFLPLSLVDLSLRAMWQGIINKWPGLCASWVGAAVQAASGVGCWFSRLRAWCVVLGALRALHLLLWAVKPRPCAA